MAGGKTTQQSKPPIATEHEGQPNPGKPFVKITKEDLSEEISFWESAVLCNVFGVNPPLQVIDGYVKRIWKNLSIEKVGLLEKLR